MSHQAVRRSCQLGLIVVLGLASVAVGRLTQTLHAQTAPEWPQLAVSPPVTGLSRPLHITQAGDDSGRLFVVEQQGRIKIVKNNVLDPVAFLDISGRVSSTRNEDGLLSMAFPPNYGSRQHFYVYYTNLAGNNVVARYRLTADADVADPGSEEILLTINHPYGVHNGGQLAFGPNDGYLYISTGDGGGKSDPQETSQNLNSFLGKLLRLDVESGARGYTIPPTNPYTQTADARPEVWARGFRNPWRFSFDRNTGDLYLGDVGAAAYEEINRQPASSRGGENYGWNFMEGAHCGPAFPQCSRSGLTLPIDEYSEGGCAVTGGMVYRGTKSLRMHGMYIYADYCTGKIWGLKYNGGRWQKSLLLDTDFYIATLGEDQAGELYVADLAKGALYRLSDSNQQSFDDAANTVTHDAWSGATYRDASGGAFRFAGAAGQSSTYRTAVASDAVTLISYRGPNQGKAQVVVDGVIRETLDLYNPTPEYRYLKTYDGLSLNRHTITVNVLGQRNPQSKGNWVWIDGFRVGTTTVEEHSPDVSYTNWSSAKSHRAFGGSFRRTAAPNASMSVRFTGTQFIWITARGPLFGMARISVDGVAVATVDLYSPTLQWQSVWTRSGLEMGTHTVTITALGTRNSSSRGNSVIFDGYSIR